MDFLLKTKPCTVGGSGRLAAAVGHKLERWRVTDLKSAAMALLGVPVCCSAGQLKGSGYNWTPEWQKPGGSMELPKATRWNLR